MIEIVIQQQDEYDPNKWYVKIGGLASDGLYRLATLTLYLATGETPQDWLDTHQEEAQAAIDAGEYNEEYDCRRKFCCLVDLCADEEQWLTETFPETTPNLSLLLDYINHLAEIQRQVIRAQRYIAIKFGIVTPTGFEEDIYILHEGR